MAERQMGRLVRRMEEQPDSTDATTTCRAIGLGLLGTLAGVVLASLLAMSLAHAHDPHHPENNGWLKELANAGGGICCAGDDVVLDPPWDIKDGFYRVMIRGEWIWVANAAVVDPGKNRDGVARAWPATLSTDRLTVRCFMPGTLG